MVRKPYMHYSILPYFPTSIGQDMVKKGGGVACYTSRLQSNEQSLHVGAVRVIFMTASRHGDKQICSISQVSFLSESPTPNRVPKHSFIMAYKAIALRVDIYQYHLSSNGKLDQMGK